MQRQILSSVSFCWDVRSGSYTVSTKVGRATGASSRSTIYLWMLQTNEQARLLESHSSTRPLYVQNSVFAVSRLHSLTTFKRGGWHANSEPTPQWSWCCNWNIRTQIPPTYCNTSFESFLCGFTFLLKQAIWTCTWTCVIYTSYT